MVHGEKKFVLNEKSRLIIASCVCRIEVGSKHSTTTRAFYLATLNQTPNTTETATTPTVISLGPI
jgi:hypothetical protein